MVEVEDVPRADLARTMEVLASPVRLSLLHRLGRPAFVPDLAREVGMTRQALKKHLDALEEAGLVVATPSRRGPLRATEYVAHPAGLFVFKQNVLALAVAADPGSLPPSPTLPSKGERAVGSPGGAGLLLVHGDQPGRWFALGHRGSFVVGRDAGADVPLAYDPFASARHALLRHGVAGWTLTDLHSTNGTLLNFRRLLAGETLPLRPGDLLTVGKSLLLLRDGG